MRPYNQLYCGLMCLTIAGALVLLLLLGGCSIYYTPSDLSTALSECETVDCVIAVKDQHKGSARVLFSRYRFMEGYPPQSLAYMKETGRLTVRKMTPAELLLVVTGPVLGWASFAPTVYGDMHRCKVVYARIPGWRDFLNHELDHCLGYADIGISPDVFGNDYTKAQKAIMKEEGVSRWIDTRFYREQMPRFYNERENFYFYLKD